MPDGSLGEIKDEITRDDTDENGAAFHTSPTAQTDKSRSWWQRIPRKWTTERENTDSTARDHLANERTFLAWVRTVVALIALGLGIAKLAPENGGLEIGLVVILLGGVLLVFSGLRYFDVKRALDSGDFRVLTGVIVLIEAVGSMFIIVVVILLLVQQHANI
jgi:putative membrane protein